DDERLAADREFARVLDAGALRVPEIVQPIDHLGLGHALAAPDRQRPREDARIGALELAVHPGVDQPREADVEIGDDAAGDDEGDADAERDVELPAPPPQEREARWGRLARRGLRRTIRGHLRSLDRIVYTIWSSMKFSPDY